MFRIANKQRQQQKYRELKIIHCFIDDDDHHHQGKSKRNETKQIFSITTLGIFLFSLIPNENWKKIILNNFFLFQKEFKNKNFCHEYSFCLVAGNTHRIFAKNLT